VKFKQINEMVVNCELILKTVDFCEIQTLGTSEKRIKSKKFTKSFIF